MEHVYGNVEYELSKTSGNERRRVSTDVSVQSVRQRNPLSSKDSLKFLLAALGLLLLCALVALCVLGILYHNKGVSYEALSEQYSSVVERLSVQERITDETEREYDALKLKYRKTHEALSNCSECQKCALCGEGWSPFGVKCYNFSTDKLNWTMSRDDCAEKGGHLVIITSQAEQDFVSSRVGEHHWIGLNDLDTEGKWVWVNNQTLNETGVTFWFKRTNHPDEPDNWTQMDPSGENCASLGDENGNTNKWFDAYCHKLKKYICEMQNTFA
ncbi:C-type lectin domain family 6 member A-like isoform X1 [Pygocentrus nattereri]|uniref:C-type lectin domain family 6 member A-like isoform X1 n=1 Tax=Pygocentrus nattereri TaxID=42514 RepID=UPI001891D7B4|nr:C-type lectin domain family 6 member A-like isoform X1 [Pygocentrus nattereri]